MPVKEESIQYVSFYFTGESFTNLVRDYWNSGLVKTAFEILTDGGMGKKDALKVCIGKLKFVGDTRQGDHTLSVEKDSSTTDISLKAQVKNHEKNFELLINQNAVLKRTIICARRPDKTAFNYRTSQSRWDKIRIESNNNEIKKILANLEILYPLVGKSLTDLPLSNIGTQLSGIEIDKIESAHETMKLHKEFNKEFNKKTRKKEDDNKFIAPVISDICESRHGWLSPRGEFYSCEYAGRRQLANDFQEMKIIPKDIIDTHRWLEENNWIKLASEEFHYFYSDTIPTSFQIDEMTKFWLNKNRTVGVSVNGNKYETISEFLDHNEEMKGLI